MAATNSSALKQPGDRRWAITASRARSRAVAFTMPDSAAAATDNTTTTTTAATAPESDADPPRTWTVRGDADGSTHTIAPHFLYRRNGHVALLDFRAEMLFVRIDQLSYDDLVHVGGLASSGRRRMDPDKRTADEMEVEDASAAEEDEEEEEEEEEEAVGARDVAMGQAQESGDFSESSRSGRKIATPRKRVRIDSAACEMDVD